MFEVEYLWNGGVKKDSVNDNLISYNCANFRKPINFVFSFRFSEQLKKKKLPLYDRKFEKSSVYIFHIHQTAN